MHVAPPPADAQLVAASEAFINAFAGGGVGAYVLAARFV
jgi:hypothetical protein